MRKPTWCEAEAETGDICPTCNRELVEGYIGVCDGYVTPVYCGRSCLPPEHRQAPIFGESPTPLS